MNPHLPQQVITTMAKRVYRMHFYLYDELRSYWLSYPPDVREKIGALGWDPPRPAVDEHNVEIVDNDSGEDYLYMHCELLGYVNRMLVDIGDPEYTRIEGWVSIPAPDDPAYPVPPAWFFPEALPVSNAFIARAKADDYFERRFRHWERQCYDAAFLKTVTLGEFGSFIEATLHDGIRSRWAAAPGAWRPDPPIAGEPIFAGFDDFRYDFLRDTYSQHLNPIYWKFHGWVQDRVEDWKVANGVFRRDFWKGTWVGKMPADHQPGGRCPPTATDQSRPLFAIFEDPDIAGQHLAEMEEVVSILAEAEARP